MGGKASRSNCHLTSASARDGNTAGAPIRVRDEWCLQCDSEGIAMNPRMCCKRGGCLDKTAEKNAEQNKTQTTHQKYAPECSIEMTELHIEGVITLTHVRKNCYNSRNITRKITKLLLKNRVDIRLFYHAKSEFLATSY